MPQAMISTSTSPSFGPSRSSSTTSSRDLARNATAARVFISLSPWKHHGRSCREGIDFEAVARNDVGIRPLTAQQARTGLDEFDLVAHPQLGTRAPQLVVDGVGRLGQCARDLLVGESANGQPNDGDLCR